jgi:hypothetical protein
LRRPQSAVTRNNLAIFGNKKGIGETEAERAICFEKFKLSLPNYRPL